MPDARPLDLAAVSDAMLMLEDQRSDPRPDVPVGQVAAKLLGVEHTRAFDEALARESNRVIELLAGHYARMGVATNEHSAAALAFVQGITFAAAVRRVKGERCWTMCAVCEVVLGAGDVGDVCPECENEDDLVLVVAE